MVVYFYIEKNLYNKYVCSGIYVLLKKLKYVIILIR